MNVSKKCVPGSRMLFALALVLSGCLAGGGAAKAVDLVIDNGGSISSNSMDSVTVTGGTATVSGIIYLHGKNDGSNPGATTITGGKLVVTNAQYKNLDNIYDTFAVNTPKKLLVTGSGQLEVGDASQTSLSTIEYGIVEFSGNSKTTIQMSARPGPSSDTSWLYGASIFANQINVNGGTIDLLANSILSANRDDDPNSPSVGTTRFTITSGAINLNGGSGTEAIIRGNGGATKKRSDWNANKPLFATPISMSGGTITTAAGKNGAILARVFDFSGGSINVDGVLTIAGSADVNGPSGGLSVVNGAVKGGIERWGDFNFNGGTMTVGSAGIVDFVAGDMTLNASAGAIDGTVFIQTAIPSPSGSYTPPTSLGVNTTNLNVTGDFSVNSLKINTAMTSGNDATPGVKVVGGALTVKNDITYDGTAVTGGDALVITKGGKVQAKTLTMGHSTNWIIVGEKTSNGTFVITDTAKLNGGTIFADPVWVDGADPKYNASSIVINQFVGDELDGSVIVGQNSHFTYGQTSSDWLVDQINEAGVWGPESTGGNYALTAAVGIHRPLTIASGGSLVVNGDVTGYEDSSGNWRPTLNGSTTFAPVGDTASFGSDSLLAVDAASLGGKAAITADSGSGTLNVEDGAKLYIVNAQNGQEYEIVKGFTTVNGNIGTDAWGARNNLSDSPMINIDLDTSSGSVVAITTANNAYDAYQPISSGTADMLNELYGVGQNAGYNAINSANPGVSFVSRATSYAFNGTDKRRHSATVEGVAQMAALGGAPLTAFNIMRLNHDAVAQRFSFNSGSALQGDSVFACDSIAGNNFSIWAGGVYEHGRVRGMDVGPFENDYKSNLGGGNLGLDFSRGDNLRFGVMGSAGGGKNKADGGDFAYTENKFDYYGVRGYAGFSMCDWSLLLDGGFTHVKNDITQDTGVVGFERNTADVKVNAWDVGVTAERRFETGFADIIPHLGVRYEGINTRGHDIRNRNYRGAIMNVGSETQHLLSIPVGVSLAKHVNVCDWRLSPYVDAGAVVTVGDRSYKPEARIPSFNRQGFKTKMVDPVAFDGSVGFNADNGRFFTGVNYNITHSKNQTTHGFWANVGVSF